MTPGCFLTACSSLPFHARLQPFQITANPVETTSRHTGWSFNHLTCTGCKWAVEKTRICNFLLTESATQSWKKTRISTTWYLWVWQQSKLYMVVVILVRTPSVFSVIYIALCRSSQSIPKTVQNFTCSQVDPKSMLHEMCMYVYIYIHYFIYTLGMAPHTVTVESDPYSESPIQNTMILVVTITGCGPYSIYMCVYMHLESSMFLYVSFNLVWTQPVAFIFCDETQGGKSRFLLWTQASMMCFITWFRHDL